MSTFSCPVVRVSEVIEHPNADRLSIVKLEGLGFTCISGKLEDGSPRYKAGDFVVYIPSAAMLPEWLLKEMDFWNDETGKGTLAGSDGNRVKPLKLRGIFSEGVLFPVEWDNNLANLGSGSVVSTPSETPGINSLWQVELGQDVAELLSITKYSPPIPVGMSGEVANMFGHTVKFDFDRWEQNTELFDPGEPVIASEKLHGSMCAILYEPNLNHPDMFGSKGEFVVHSKGLGAQGLAFKNNDANTGNLYVRTLKSLLDAGLENRLKESFDFDAVKNIALIGEIFGLGVQDLHYGLDKPGFRVFDIRIENVFDTRYLTQDKVKELLGKLGIDMVPTVYEGPFDVAELEKVRDGKTMLGGANIREGIVVRSATETHHAVHGRKICKFISPDYLLRKSKDATEYQ
jgi:RNA ligase (TIGR02306 family)